MTDPTAVRDEHLRITILRLLAQQPDYALNESVLSDLLRPFAFGIGRDKLRTELSWLGDQSLLTINDLHGLLVATITERGLDVSQGAVTAPGVKRPSPRS